MEIHYDPTFKELVKALENMEEESEFVIHYPSLQLIKDESIKEKLEAYFVQYSSMKNQKSIMYSNFRENIKNIDSNVDILKDTFKNKDLYIVAAGPSLDKNFMQLKDIGDNGIILATGTVLRKLLKANIRPDYFLVTDANPRVYGQIMGLEDSNIPLLCLSTAYMGFAKKYKGKKYIILQKDFKLAESYAKANLNYLFHTGGSVSTTALDIGIQFECKRIIFIGLDLAYSENYAHASDTAIRDFAQTEDLIQIMDINGNQVYTTKVLNIYRRWIEERIKNVTDIEFIDATEGGAKISGMKIKTLKDVIAKE